MLTNIKIDLSGIESATVVKALTWLTSDARLSIFGEIDVNNICLVNAARVKFERSIEDNLNKIKEIDTRHSDDTRVILLNDCVRTMSPRAWALINQGKLQVFATDLSIKEEKVVDISVYLSEYEQNKDKIKPKLTEQLDVNMREVINSSIMPRLSATYGQVSLNTSRIEENNKKLNKKLNKQFNTLNKYNETSNEENNKNFNILSEQNTEIIKMLKTQNIIQSSQISVDTYSEPTEESERGQYGNRYKGKPKTKSFDQS